MEKIVLYFISLKLERIVSALLSFALMLISYLSYIVPFDTYIRYVFLCVSCSVMTYVVCPASVVLVYICPQSFFSWLWRVNVINISVIRFGQVFLKMKRHRLLENLFGPFLADIVFGHQGDDDLIS